MGMTSIEQALKILQAAVIALYRIIIFYIITMITRRFHHGHEPNTLNAQIGLGFRILVVQIINLIDNSLKISDTITV